MLTETRTRQKTLSPAEFSRVLDDLVERSASELDETRALHHALLARKLARS